MQGNNNKTVVTDANDERPFTSTLTTLGARIVPEVYGFEVKLDDDGGGLGKREAQ